MYYEVNARVQCQDEKGHSQSRTDKYIVTAVTFGEAEQKVYQFLDGGYSVDVNFIKRSRIMEFANTQDEGDKIYIAKLDCTSIDDDCHEKHIKYSVGIYAADIIMANTECQLYMKQGLNDMTLTDMNESNIKALIE